MTIDKLYLHSESINAEIQYPIAPPSNIAFIPRSLWVNAARNTSACRCGPLENMQIITMSCCALCQFNKWFWWEVSTESYSIWKGSGGVWHRLFRPTRSDFSLFWGVPRSDFFPLAQCKNQPARPPRSDVGTIFRPPHDILKNAHQTPPR